MPSHAHVDSACVRVRGIARCSSKTVVQRPMTCAVSGIASLVAASIINIRKSRAEQRVFLDWRLAGSTDEEMAPYEYHTHTLPAHSGTMHVLTPAFVGIPGGMEMIVILAIAVLLFGANKLPKLARSSGQALGEFKKGREEIETELREATASESTSDEQETETA